MKPPANDTTGVIELHPSPSSRPWRVLHTAELSPLYPIDDNVPMPTIADLNIGESLDQMECGPTEFRAAVEEAWSLTRETGKRFEVRHATIDGLQCIQTTRIA